MRSEPAIHFSVFRGRYGARRVGESEAYWLRHHSPEDLGTAIRGVVAWNVAQGGAARLVLMSERHTLMCVPGDSFHGWLPAPRGWIIRFRSRGCAKIGMPIGVLPVWNTFSQ